MKTPKPSLPKPDPVLRRIIEETANKEAFFKFIKAHQKEVDRRIAACRAFAAAK